MSLLCTAAVLCACGGQSESMQTLASREVPYFYAVGMDAATQAYLIAGNDEGYYIEYMIPGYTAPTGQAVMCVGKSGRAYIGDINVMYTSSRDDYSSWSSQVIGGANPISIAATHNGDFMLGDSIVLYRYEEDSSLWVDTGKTSTLGIVAKCCYSPLYHKLYVLDNESNEAYIQELTTGASLQFVAAYPGITNTRNFFSVVDGGFYIGNSTEGLFLNGRLIGSRPNIESYAVVSPADIFAGTGLLSPPLWVFRLVGGSFIPEFSLQSAVGQVRLWPMPPDHIIIGISGSTTDGLYVYNFKKPNLRKLNSMPIFAVFSSAQ